MKKTVLILSIAVILLISIILVIKIQFKDEYPQVTIASNEIMSNISQSLKGEFSQTIEIDDTSLNEMYGIDSSKLDNYIIKVPIMNIRADEIAIIKVKEIKDVNYIVNKFKERASIVQNTFNKYLEDQYELAVNNIIVVKGKYVLFSISEKNEQIENIFNSYFASKMNNDEK